MTTAAEIIDLALRDSGVFGVGQTPQAQQVNDALTRLNMMIGQWNRRRWLVYHLVDVTCALSGAASYQLGAAQLLNIARLDKIDGAYIRVANVDTPLVIMHSMEEFRRVRAQAQAGNSVYAFYDSGYPYGQVYVWPVQAAGALHVLGKAVLQQFPTLATTVNLPPEYYEALYSNLVVRLRAAYRLPPDAYYTQLAQENLAVLEQANLQDSKLRLAKVAGRSIGDLINLALEDSGAFDPGKPPSYQDTQDALWRLNMTIAQWNQRRWLIYHLVDTSVNCTGALSYSVGSGGDFNIQRPANIEAAYIRQVVPSNPTPIDWPLSQIMSREEYTQIALKTLSAAPSEAFFYDSGYPLGRLYPWPLPNNQYQLHILTKEVLSQFATAQDVVNLPPEYELALHATIVVDARSAYQLPPDPVKIGKAKAALNTLRKANFQVGRLSMPKGVGQGPAYNVYSDQGG
jgi:hypothetical protein